MLQSSEELINIILWSKIEASALDGPAHLVEPDVVFVHGFIWICLEGVEVVEISRDGFIITRCTHLLKVFQTCNTILMANLRDIPSKNTVGVLINCAK